LGPRPGGGSFCFLRSIRGHASDGQHLHPFGPGALESAGDFIHRRTRSVNIINHNDGTTDFTAHFKRPRQIPFSFVPREAGLAWGGLSTAEQAIGHTKTQPGCDKFSLIKPACALSRPVKRDRYDEIPGERLPCAAFLQDIAERLCQGHAIGIFEMVDDLTKRVREQQRRSCEIECVFTLPACPAQSLDCRRGFAALWAKRWFERYKTRPTFRTCPSPSALLNLSVTDSTCDWEQEVENEIEQSAFGETQRAKVVYKTEKVVSTQDCSRGHVSAVFLKSTKIPVFIHTS